VRCFLSGFLIKNLLFFQVKEIMKFQIPFGEFGDPEDIGEAAAFLLSKKAKYISGTTLSVNGALYN
jgi:NAD(P)-dependent dehydrogenase (short-subunit alcohol dehydrogenase family)